MKINLGINNLSGIESGDILFFETEWFTDIVNLPIMILTRSKITHVGIAYWIYNELFVLESQYGRDRTIVHIDTYKGRVCQVTKPPYNWDSIKREVLLTISKEPYGYLDLIGVGLVNFLRLFGIKTTMPNFKGEICSEFVANLCGIKPSNISPKDLFEILKKAQ